MAGPTGFGRTCRSIWVRNFPVKGQVKAYFQVLDKPEVGEFVKGTGATVVEGSVQTTNSWGLRGPEPNLRASWRGIVLGDSYMQGLFVGDAETPTECLKHELESRLLAPVEILNTGHLGYSPEQYYYTLLEYGRRLPPQFVVVSIFANDFGGDVESVLNGNGDWEEAGYWLWRIRQYCLERDAQFLVVPAPWVRQIEEPQLAGYYPGRFSNVLEATGLEYLDPIDDFVNAHLEASLELRKAGQSPTGNTLFNGHVGDAHFSLHGCRVWATGCRSPARACDRETDIIAKRPRAGRGAKRCQRALAFLDDVEMTHLKRGQRQSPRVCLQQFLGP